MNTSRRLQLLAASIGVLLFGAASRPGAAAAPFIVKDGQANAQIIISENPPRMTRLAAEELQAYIAKITGATLTITNIAREEAAAHVFVGRSAYTDKRNLDTADLKNGAFRMVSGDAWLALLGQDDDFIPPEPYARNGGTSEQARVTREWDRLTGATWKNPVGASMYRGYSKSMGIWHDDRHGSLNAVHHFLRTLGVRWYMPGELGEIVPKMRTLALPDVNRVVTPDFALRLFYLASYFSSPREDIMWYLRLGLNHGGDVRRHYFTHGMRDVTGRDETRAAHPEYFALNGGRRDAEKEQNGNQCLSSEGFFQENVRFVRAMFDIYDLPMVSVMPSDGYQVCQCPLCKDKIDWDRDRAGRISNYVWGYVDRIARELYRTHPDRKISCSAYADYTLPPTNIDQLSPNIVVAFTHGRGKHFTDPAVRKQKEELWRVWLEKSSNPLVINEHYVFTHRGTFLPVYFPHAIAAGLQASRGKSLGETIETAIGPSAVRGHGLHRPGFNHLNLYVTARMYWDAEQDVDALLDEYYRLFYGPAAREMKAFIEYSENNWSEMSDDVARIDKTLALLAAAQAKAPADSPYVKRIALVAEYLTPLHNLRQQLATGRDNAPQARVARREGAEGNIVVDGKLGFDWSSQAEVAAQIEADGWTVEARIPVTGTDTPDDPLNGVVGRAPTTSYPWFFNVCRQRVRPNDVESSCFSPTGTSNFHDRMKFGRLYAR